MGAKVLIKMNQKQAGKMYVENMRLEEYLEKINTIMWNTLMIKGKNFGRDEGLLIMDVLNKWAER